MLTLNSTLFTTGQVTYEDVDPNNQTGKCAIYLQVQLPIDGGIRVYALVDTGSPYCIFNTELVEALGLPSDNGEIIPLHTPRGVFHGTIQRVTMSIMAEQGDSLDIDASVYVPEDEWHFGNFLGYTGFLERLRFAVDPSTNTFYFGACD